LKAQAAGVLDDSEPVEASKERKLLIDKFNTADAKDANKLKLHKPGDINLSDRMSGVIENRLSEKLDTCGSQEEEKYKDENQLAEKNALIQIYEQEKGHGQWRKHSLNFFIFGVLVFLDVFRGSKHSPSIFGVKPCSWEDWTSLSLYVVICAVVCLYSVRNIQWEQDLKKRYGKGLEPGDIDMEGKNLGILLFFSGFGGFASGALGLGGGSIFNPLLLSMGVPPKVASASGMYMIIFATGSSTVAYIINDMLNLDYSLWVGSFNVAGTILGMIALRAVMKKLNRQSPLVFLLVLIFSISVIACPYFGIKDALRNKSQMWDLNSIC
jgi:hypothetical protein